MLAAFRANAPQPVRYVLSGGLGSAAFWVLNEACYAALPPDTPERTTVAWTVSYIIEVALQWLLHTFLVYGGDLTLRGLLATYAAYSGALVVSVPINAALVHGARLEHGAAWGTTLVSTGVGNYFLLSYVLGGRDKEDEVKRK